MQYQTRTWLLAAAFGLCSLPASAQLFNKMGGVESKKQSDVQEVPVQPQTQQPAVTTTDSKQATTQQGQGSVASLANFIDGTQTLAGQFQQIVYSGRGEDVSGGTFRLKRPGMFDWQYTTPSEQRIISNGSKVYHYDQDLEQITIRSRSELAGDVAMNLLVGDTKLQQSFNVAVQPEAKAPAQLRTGEAGLTFYQLKPKGSKDDIDQVWVVMHNDNIAAVYVDSGVGQQSLIILNDVKRNSNIATKSFQFTPPAGVDVIGG